MIYITSKQKPKNCQITWEDILENRFKSVQPEKRFEKGCTITRRYEAVPQNLKDKTNLYRMINCLKKFNTNHRDLINQNKTELYTTFYIPKHSGGMRRIDAPNETLKAALRELKAIFEEELYVLHHTAAFAYVPGRCAVDAVRKHQRWESKWFLKTDFSDFFGSTTQPFLEKMLSQIFPFCEIMTREDGKEALHTALSLCFLKGGLPQGTPISPMLTNVMMIPIDYTIFNTLSPRKFVYTRYADDILISAKEKFYYIAVVKEVTAILKSFGAPFVINPQKTRFGSSAGSNWNLGVMLNKDNQITIGYKKKQQFKAACNNFLRDYQDGKHWDKESLMALQGLTSYYLNVEKDYITHILVKTGEKYGRDFMQILKHELSV